MKVKEIITTTLEGMGLPAPSKKLLTPRHKVRIMEELLLMEHVKAVSIADNAKHPSFVQNAARLLKENNLGEFFDVLKMCREMEQEEKEKRTGFLK